MILVLTAGSPHSAGAPATSTVTASTPEPDHGVNASTHYALWSGDRDDPNTTAFADLENETQTPLLQALATTTDIAFDSPPAAVERWNHGEVAEFPTSDAERSVAPSHAIRTNGSYLADVHATVFAVQPSTVVHISETDSRLYAARNGTLLGTVDYRVEVPESSETNDSRTNWTLVSHEIVETRLLVDGVQTVHAGSGSHTPQFTYRLGEPAGTVQRLTLEADVSVAISERIDACVNATATGVCDDWRTTTATHEETLTVRDSVDVVVYDPHVSARRARYPDGDVGWMVSADQPWAGFSLSETTTQGVWRFYSARDPAWDRLVVRTEDEFIAVESPLRPLQVFAYPSRADASTSRGTLLDVSGPERTAPTLPPDVYLDVVTTPYTESDAIAIRVPQREFTSTEGEASEDLGVVVHGLVRGTTVRPQSDSISVISIRRSDLSLSVTESTPETVTVEAELIDAETGVPIETATRAGYVVVQGERVETNATGLATVTVSRPTGGLSARYVSESWWQSTHTLVYTGDSTLVAVGQPPFDVASVAYTFVVAVGLTALAAVFVDRSLGIRLWPLRRHR